MLLITVFSCVGHIFVFNKTMADKIIATNFAVTTCIGFLLVYNTDSN